jgi:hypothetical protein
MSEKARSEGEGGGFLEKILSLFLPGSDPEREKRRLLKDIARDLKKKKFKFYKPASKEALPALGKFFHDIYKVIGPAQVLLEHAAQSNVLKTIIIEYSLSEEIRTIRDELTEEAISARAGQMDTKTLTADLRDKMVNFYAAFKGDKVREIDGSYNLLSSFLQFVNFDYYFLLKKFDSGLPERDLAYNPKFETINAEYVSEDLKDFLEVMPLVTGDSDWDRLFDILRSYKDSELVNRAAWKKTVKRLETIQNDGILELIVRHIDDDPYYKSRSIPPNERIVEEYLNRIKTQSEMTVQKILKEKQNQKVDSLLKVIFGTTAVSRMRNYTEKENLKFSKKMLGGYIYVAPLNYIKAFLLDYVKKDIKGLMDLLLIRGKWSTNLMSQQLSESFHTVMEISDRLIKFDESLSDEGERGLRMKQYMGRSNKDKNAMVSLRKVLKEVNEEAVGYIQLTAQNLIVIGKSLKQVLEDYEKKPHELIINWKEIEQYSEKDIKTGITEIYKKIYYFIQLLQFYTKKGS